VGFPAPPPKPHKNGGGSGAQPHGPGPGPGPGPAGTYLLLDVIARRGRHRRRGNGVGVAALDHVPVLLARQLHGDVVVVVQVPLLPPPPNPPSCQALSIARPEQDWLGQAGWQSGRRAGGTALHTHRHVSTRAREVDPALHIVGVGAHRQHERLTQRDRPGAEAEGQVERLAPLLQRSHLINNAPPTPPASPRPRHASVCVRTYMRAANSGQGRCRTHRAAILDLIVGRIAGVVLAAA
jgi:hypothetical protein